MLFLEFGYLNHGSTVHGSVRMTHVIHADLLTHLIHQWTTRVVRVQHSPQLVGDGLWNPSEDNVTVTVVNKGRHEGVHERRGRLRGQ